MMKILGDIVLQSQKYKLAGRNQKLQIFPASFRAGPTYRAFPVTNTGKSAGTIGP